MDLCVYVDLFGQSELVERWTSVCLWTGLDVRTSGCRWTGLDVRTGGWRWTGLDVRTGVYRRIHQHVSGFGRLSFVTVIIIPGWRMREAICYQWLDGPMPLCFITLFSQFWEALHFTLCQANFISHTSFLTVKQGHLLCLHFLSLNDLLNVMPISEAA